MCEMTMIYCLYFFHMSCYTLTYQAKDGVLKENGPGYRPIAGSMYFWMQALRSHIGSSLSQNTCCCL